MQELLWLDHLPDEKLEGGVALVNQLWQIEVKQTGTQWCVCKDGETIFEADAREAVDAFLYGLSLAYSVLPEPMFERVRADVKRSES